MTQRRDDEPGRAGHPGGERRRLERAPGDRYTRDTRATPAREGATAGRLTPGRRAILAASLVSDVGAVVFFGLGLLDPGIGLLVVAAFVGWATALAFVWWGRDAVAAVRTRVAIAAILGAWAVAFGMGIDWLYGIAQGGVLGPLDYVQQRYEAIGPLSVLVAAVVAAARVR